MSVRFTPFVRPAFPALFALASVMPLGGCIPAVIGGAAGAGYAASDERGISGQVNDTAIKAQIAQKWREYNSDMARQLTLEVYQGRVLIVGPVSNPEYGDEAVKRAWQVNGVKEVNADVPVASHLSFAREAHDSLITSELRTKLVFDSQIRSINYNIDTVNGTVYLVGSARSQDELDRVTEYARNVSGVRRVVSYVRLRSGAAESEAEAGAAPRGARSAPPSDSGPVASPTAPQPPFGAPQGGTTGGPTGGAIESHPL